MYERRDVWALTAEDPWHPTLLWYARAVRAMQARNGIDFSNPTSWRYLAEMHGTDIERSRRPAGATWNECQHFSWFFLPWHRIYLYHFEWIVRQAVGTLGGPASWALPYWNYDAAKPATLALPPAFREPRLPDGSDNPLLVTARGPNMNTTGRLPAAWVSHATAFGEPRFVGQGGQQTAGFGGPQTGWNHSGGTLGSLENEPHGGVHMGVGGTRTLGLMSRFETAGQDPIFWLHHANIDRLWEEWLAAGHGHANPTEASWHAMPFVLGQGAARTSLTVGDVVDTTRAPLSYRYVDGPTMATRSAPAPTASLLPPTIMADALPPEKVGSTTGRIPLGAVPTHARVSVAAPSGPLKAMTASARPHRIFVRVENVRGSQLSTGVYEVFLNLPADANAADHPAHRIGQLSMFGVVEASRTDQHHDGSGLTYSFDVTALAQRLMQTDAWDPTQLRVTFVPAPDSAGQVYEGDLGAERVSVYYG